MTSDGVPVGSCRLRAELHRVPATLGKCALYRGRGQPAPPPGRGGRPRGARAGPSRRTAAPPAPPPLARPESWSPEQVSLHAEARAALGGDDRRPMLSRFRDGQTLVVDGSGRELSHSNERIFQHLCRLRSALDALEGALPDEDLKGQVRRARGSLTTFNFLFHDPADQFSGKP